MFHVLLVWLFSALLLLTTAALVPGFKINSFVSALTAALVVGLLNALLRPILLFLSFPINFLTLGLFTFVVNAAILRLAAGTLRGFAINGWVPAIFGAIILGALQTLMLTLL